MMKMLLPFLLLLGVAEAAQPPILWGPNNTTEFVTSGLNLNGNVSIYSGTQDPSSVATVGVEGDLFIQYGASGGKLFIKQDNGTTTSWTYLFAGTPGTGTGDVLHTGNSFGVDVSLGANDAHNTFLLAGGVAKLEALSTGIALLDNMSVANGKAIQFKDASTHIISVKAPSTSATFPIILPTSLPGSGTDCLMIDSTGQVSHSACYSGISSVGPGTSLVSGSFNVKSIIGTNNISVVDNGDGSISLGETNTHLPGTGTVQSVDFYADDTSTFGVTKALQNSNPVFHLTPQVQGANTIWAAPNGANGNPIWRKGVINDLTSGSTLANKVPVTDGMGGWTYQFIPAIVPFIVTTFNTRFGDVLLNAADVGGVIAATPTPHGWVNSLSSAGVFSFSQPDFSDLTGTAALAQISSSGASTGQAITYNGASNVWGPVATSASSPLTYTAGAIGCQTASGSQAGCLSSADWTTFNGKQAAGNYITALTGDGTASGPGAAALTLATVNSNVGTFNNLTVNGKGLVTAASNASYEVPLTFSTGLTRTVNTVTVNTAQNISTLSNLTSDGFVKTSGGTGALSIDTSTYLTGNQTITLSGDVSGSGTTAITTAIGANKVANSQLSQMAAHTFKGNNTGSTANALDLTATQLTAELNNFVGDSGSGGTKGLVPAPAAGDTSANKVLGASGSWVAMAGGGGSKNYISIYTPSLNPSTPNTGNGDFELNATTGFSLFNTTLTSGIPTGSITAGAASITTFAATASNPIEKKYSLNVASSGAIAAGAGWISDAFYIDQADQAKVLAFQIKYSVLSGAANINQSGTSSNTFAAYLYDVTNSAWIQPSGVYNMVGNGLWNGTFQTSSNGTNYRIAVIAVNASGGAASLNFDSYVVGPQPTSIAPAISDLVTATTNGGATLITGTTSNPTKGTIVTDIVKVGRIGDHAHITMQYQQSSAGTAGSGDYLIALPNGLSFDSSKVTYTTSVYGTSAWQTASSLGGGTISYSTTSSGLAHVVPFDSTHFRLFVVSYVGSGTAGTGAFASTNFDLSGTVNTFSVDFKAPIAGWSSNTVSSADTDTRIIATEIAGTPANVSSGNPVIFPSVLSDTSASYNNSTGKYTAPISGYYNISSAFNAAGVAGPILVYVFVNGAQKSQIGAYSASGTFSGSQIVKVNAYDTVDIRPVGAGISSFGDSSLSINRISGPAVVQAVDSVNVRYHASATSISGSLATVVWTAKDFDSQGAMNAATGIYTCPVSGKYQVNASLITGGTFSLNNAVDLQIQLNGSVYTEQTNYAFASATDISVNVSDIIPCNQGGTIQAQVSSTAISPSIAASNSKNWISISRVGN